MLFLDDEMNLMILPADNKLSFVDTFTRDDGDLAGGRSRG